MSFKDYIDINKTKFESKMLGKNIVSIKDMNIGCIKKLTTLCKRRGYDYIVSQINLNQRELISEMLNNKFSIYGYPIILKAKLDKEYKKSESIREFERTNLKEMKRITKGAFPDVHWYSNKQINRGNINKLYIKWLENSCDGRAEIVFVYEENNKILGYVTCKKLGKVGTIDLIAVSNKAKGNSIGKTLVNAVQGYFKKRNFKELEVKTDIRNIAALNLYIKSGFRIHWIGLNINRWLK